MIQITKDIAIAEECLGFRFSRSSGPGGQNVNKLNTRVMLLFDVARCTTLSDIQKKRILSKLATRANKKDVIRVISQRFRTQKANRNAAVEKLIDLLTSALTRKPPRRKTKIPRHTKIKRLEDKKRRSLLKKQRTKPADYQ